MSDDDKRLLDALSRIDELNAADPRRVVANGREWPVECLYSVRMSDRLASYQPAASAALQIAARAQHLERWILGRSEFEEGRVGYKRWRAELAIHHGARAHQVCREVGYDEAFASRVSGLIQKRQMKSDRESQALEDVVCLVFIEHYLADFAAKHTAESVVSILRKTWPRLSERGQATAVVIKTDATVARLLSVAVEADPDHGAV